MESGREREREVVEEVVGRGQWWGEGGSKEGRQ